MKGEKVDGRTGNQRHTGPAGGQTESLSLNNLKVVQDGHDVLRHEHVAGVYGHTGHRDEQGV